MLEVIFSDSAVGWLNVALGKRNYFGGGSSAIIVGKNGDDHATDQKDIQKMISEEDIYEKDHIIIDFIDYAYFCIPL